MPDTEEGTATPFLKSVAIAGIGAALLAACGDDGAATTTTAPSGTTRAGTATTGATKTGHGSKDADLIAGAIELEQQAIFAYNAAAKTGALSDAVLQIGIKFRDQHKAHEDALSTALKAAGGTPPTARTTYDLTGPGGAAPDLTSEEGIIRYAAYLENVAAQTYLSAVGQFSTGELAQASANLMGVEARHAAVLRSAVNDDPVPAAFLDKQT